MNKNEIVTILTRIVFTLSEIPTFGEENLDRLCGCIRYLKSIIEMLGQEDKENDNG